ncbi:hypothetical protein D3C75_580820 [compost metagenome]
MRKKESYTGTVSLIYAAVVILTVFSFMILGFSESLFRFIVTILSVLAAESAVYGYTVFWLRTVRSSRRTSRVLISGACLTAVYAAAVIVSAALLDWVLELNPFLYAAEQLAILIISAVILGAVGIYGRNAAAEEQRTADAVRIHRQHQAELQDIKELAGTWRHPGADWLEELVAGVEERFQYSDPVSHSSLFATENMLTQQISLLYDQVTLLRALQNPGSNWEESASELAESISGTLQRRNRELAALK